jgi:hypothetical protein
MLDIEDNNNDDNIIFFSSCRKTFGLRNKLCDNSSHSVRSSKREFTLILRVEFLG